MPVGNFRRILQPSLVQNEKDVSYPIHSLSRTQIKTLLSAPLAGGGVFGLEAHYVDGDETLVFFAPPYYKTEWEPGERDPIFEQLHEHKKQITFVQLYTTKSSFFPLSMQHTESFWGHIRNIVPDHIGVVYQIVLAYRQDNWKERLREQYEDYLSGIERPSDKGWMRKIQRRIDESLDNLLKWEFKYAEIPEVEQKIQENGFRYSIRLAFYGSHRYERRKLVEEVKNFLRQMEYVNEWGINTFFLFDDIIQNIQKRKLDNVGKHQVLSVSELLPLIMSESVVYIEEPAIVKKSVKSKAANPFHLLPVGKKIKQVDGAKIAQKFIYALQELRIIKEEIVAKRTQCGPTMVKITFDLPKGLRLSDITKKNVIEDIQTHMGVKHLQIVQGEDIGEFDILLPQEERQKIFLRDYVDTPEFMEFASKHALPFFVGVDVIGRPIYRCLAKIRHILVAGTTGSGKSVWLNQLILTLLLIRKPDELWFYMIDIKQVELTIYNKFPHVQKVITNVKEAIKTLRQLQAEMNRRYSLFSEAQVKNIGLYNKKHPENKLPYIVCVIDEYAELALRTDGVHDLVQSLAQLARAAGIHLIISTQKPMAEVIPTLIRDNFPGRIGFSMTTGGYLTIFDSKPPEKALGNGDGWMQFEGELEPHIRFQGCLIIDDPNNDDLESELIEKIADTMEDYEGGELPEPEMKEEEYIEEKESELDKLKRIIAQTRETRVSQLREMMKININRLNDLMKELVDEGWLQKPETKQQGYQLIASEEELEKWRL
jgi:DNA segregation ATPase FtsK/SpoIIIE, S-DNA-T family